MILRDWERCPLARPLQLVLSDSLRWDKPCLEMLRRWVFGRYPAACEGKEMRPCGALLPASYSGLTQEG